MAKKSMTERESKKINCVKKYLNKRQELNAILKTSTNDEEIDAARLKLAKLPVNSSPSRVTNRCQQCGRPHAVYRKFELCRICLRNELMNGNVTGGRKSSW